MFAHRPPESDGWALGTDSSVAVTVPVPRDRARTENGLPGPAKVRMSELEQGAPDVNKFTALARAAVPAASLSDATEGDLDRSVRQCEVRRPHGFADELRAVLSTSGRTWGALTLLRETNRPFFTTRDARRAVRRVGPVAARSRADTGGDDGDGAAVPPATARARTRTGRWLTVRASHVGDPADARIAVTLDPAHPPQLAPLIADAYGLTDRERRVTELVARGHDTRAIAGDLRVSAYTVQDHLE